MTSRSSGLRSLVGLVVVVAVAATVGACTGAVVSSTAGWVIGPLIAVTMLPVVLRTPSPDEPDEPSGRSGGAPGRVLEGDAEPEWAADRLDDEPRPGDWDGRPGPT